MNLIPTFFFNLIKIYLSGKLLLNQIYMESKCTEDRETREIGMNNFFYIIIYALISWTIDAID